MEQQGQPFRVLGGDSLGGGLAEYQEDDREGDGGDDDAAASPPVNGDRGGQGGGGGIDQRVAEEDDGEEPLRPLDHPGNMSGAPDLRVDQVFQAETLQGDEGGFRAGEKGGKHQADHQEDDI